MTGLTTAAVLHVLAATEPDEFVHRARALAVGARAHIHQYTTAELAFVSDVARVKRTAQPVAGIPATTIPALLVTVAREHPELTHLEVHGHARDLAHHALRARADVLADLFRVREAPPVARS